MDKAFGSAPSDTTRDMKLMLFVGVASLLIALRLIIFQLLPDGVHYTDYFTVIASVAALGWAFVAFGLWFMSRETAGARTLFWAFIAAVGYAVLSNLWPWLYVNSAPPMLLANVFQWVAVACGVVAPFLLGIGLIRSNLVDSWVGWLALAWGVSWVLGLFLGGQPMSIYLNAAFLLGLGVSLLLRSRGASNPGVEQKAPREVDSGSDRA